MDRVQTTKTFLWTILGLAAAVGITRFVFGLGATTNLSDATPWGVWIGFDVLSGVALAAGGFVITALFYIMKRDEFHPFVKPAVLTAFLGYVAVVVGLLFDLGLPWNIWHMIVFWNPHSPLFEVGWCVMLYSSVLLLEFSPVPLEHQTHYAKIRNFLMKFRLPLVFLGIMLSTLHQSSLGSLFLIMPFKLNPLWYSSILPVQFFISAIALGFMMVIFESLISHWIYRRETSTERVGHLAYYAFWVLAVYLIVKFVDLGISGEFGMIFSGTWESWLFISEILISALIPMVIFGIPKLRFDRRWQWVGSIMVVFGMIYNRINIGGLTMLRTTGDSYFPSWMEITISLGVVSGAVLVFMFAIEHFNVWDKRPIDDESDPAALPKFDRASGAWLGTPGVAARTRYSLAFVFAFALGFALIPDAKIHSEGVETVKVSPARGGDTLYVDGNLNGYGVSFDHKKHEEYANKKQACATCHHMNLPLDQNSGCWQCHERMYTVTDVFDHDWHASPDGAAIKCGECHPSGQVKTGTTAKSCDECHKKLKADKATITIDQYYAVSYTDAMHGACIGCHKQEVATAKEMGKEEKLQNLDRCSACHESQAPEGMEQLLKYEDLPPTLKPVILPEAKAN